MDYPNWIVETKNSSNPFVFVVGSNENINKIQNLIGANQCLYIGEAQYNYKESLKFNNVFLYFPNNFEIVEDPLEFTAEVLLNILLLFKKPPNLKINAILLKFTPRFLNYIRRLIKTFPETVDFMFARRMHREIERKYDYTSYCSNSLYHR